MTDRQAEQTANDALAPVGVSIGLATLGTLSTVEAQSFRPCSIRPFKLNVPQVRLDDMRRRIAATQWPERETVSDHTQGAQLEKGGHFAAGEQPQLFSQEMRAAFRQLRRA